MIGPPGAVEGRAVAVDGQGRRLRRRGSEFVGADVDGTVDDAGVAALVGGGQVGASMSPCVDGGTAGEQGHGLRWDRRCWQAVPLGSSGAAAVPSWSPLAA